MTIKMKQIRLDPELEPFLGSFPPANLTDPVTAREQLAALAAVALPPDTTGLEIEDQRCPATRGFRCGSTARTKPKVPSSGSTAAAL